MPLNLAAAAMAQTQMTWIKAALATPVPYVAVIGDSITNPDCNTSNQVTPAPSTSVLKGTNGFMTWALILSGQRVAMPAQTNVWSFPAQETSVIRANLPAFLAQMPVQPSVLVFECGTNNILHDPTGATTGSFASITGDWLWLATFAAARGIRCIFVPILPRDPTVSGLTAFTPFQYDMIDRCNQWLNNLARRSGGLVAVASACLPFITDPSQVGAKPKANFSIDGTHPGSGEAYYMGAAIAAILNTWFPPIDLLPASNNTWSATALNNNWLVNGQMQGTSGTVNADGAGGTNTGQCPTSWTALSALASGLTCTHSVVTSAVSGLPMHQMQFSGSYTVSGASAGATFAYYARLYQSVGGTAAASLTAGQAFEALTYFEVDAGSTGLSFPSLQFRWNGSGNYNADLYPGPRDLPPVAIQGVLRTPAHTYVAGDLPLGGGAMAVDLRTYLTSYPNGSVTASGKVRFGRTLIQKVAA